MNSSPTSKPPLKPAGQQAKRLAREAEALRANLAKRKEQSRARQHSSEHSETLQADDKDKDHVRDA